MTGAHANIMAANEFKEVEQDNKIRLDGDHTENTRVDEYLEIRNDDASCHEGIMVSSDHPQKLSVPLCSFYLQTGSCTFGSDCKFEHSTKEDAHGLGYITSSKEVGQLECKFNLLPGGCKSGNDCRFMHDAQLNFLGLPIRPSEKKCPFYMRTGGCKYASKCRFHHPEPMAVVGEDSFQTHRSEESSQHCGPVENSYETPWPLKQTSNEQTAFLGLPSYNQSPFTPKYELQPIEQWNEHQTVTTPLHFREMNINDQPEHLSSNDTIAYELSGAAKSRQFEEYPQRPSEPECQHFMKTGYCKFKSACRYHHPNGLLLKTTNSNYQNRCSVEQFPGMLLPPENISNKQKSFTGLPSSYVPGPFMPSAQGFRTNIKWNENQIVNNPPHPQEMNIICQQKYIANKTTAYEFSHTVESQQFDEYPQRPTEPECMHFMKTGYCKFKLACRYHHPNVLPLKPMSSNFQGFQPNMQWNGNQIAISPLHTSGLYMNKQEQESAKKDFALEFSGAVESQQFPEYPQRPSEPKCDYFMKTGYCKFKLACRFHHPNTNLDLPRRLAFNNNAPDGDVKHLRETPLALINTSNEQTIILRHPSSNQMPQPSVQWSDQMGRNLLYPPEIKINEQGKESVNLNMAYSFCDPKSQQLDKHLQLPCEPECQDSVKSESGRLKSAYRNHCQKPDLSFLGMLLRPVRNKSEQDNPKDHLCDASLPSTSILNGHELPLDVQWNGVQDKPLCTYYSRHGICKFGSTCRFNHHMGNSS